MSSNRVGTPNKVPKFNNQHINKLNEGSVLWNSWLEEQKKLDNSFTPVLEEANLHGIDFSNINFQGANLKNANLQNTRLKNANLQDADLEGAKLAYATNVMFSDTKIQGAIITSTTKAPWLDLKKSYTNIMMVFTLAAVFSFFLPYLINIATWRSINFAQELNHELELSLSIVANELRNEGHPLSSTVGKLSEKAENTTSCLADECKSWRLWELLLGFRRHWLFAITSIFLLLYNFARLYLTREVSILKDSEQATGITPRWKTNWPKWFNLIPYPSGGYQHLFWIHRWPVRILFWLAVASIIFQSIFWLGTTIELPVKSQF